jgi:hypothetical protein
VAHFSHTFAHSVQSFFTVVLLSFIALIAVLQEEMQSLQSWMQVVILASLPLVHMLSQLLHDLIHSLQAAIQALYFSIEREESLLSFEFENSGFAVIESVINPMIAMKKIAFFILFEG